jgi:tetratricopeptide (TPR) repeat protein
MSQRVLSISEFQNAISAQLKIDGDTTKYHFLIGAGFSYSASIPTANQIAGILAHRKNRRSPGDIRSTIRMSLQGEINTENEFVKLRRSTPALAEADYPELYSKLLSDLSSFPGIKLSRQEFIESLLSVAHERSFGYNYESLYLAYICEYWRGKAQKLQTIVTTNFDDVIPTSFAKIGATCRLLDKAETIAHDTGDSKYPRIAYLHGRFVDYDLVNTQGEIRTTTKAASNKTNFGQVSVTHGEAISKFMNLISSRSGLIVIGYAGWEDAVMVVLSEIVAQGGFPAGIFWCCLDDFNKSREKIRELHRDYDHIYAVEKCTALEVMKALLSASEIPETTVVETVRAVASRMSENFEKRWVQIEHDRHGFSSPCLSLEERQRNVRPPDIQSILDKIDKASLDARHTQLALEFLHAALRQVEQIPRAVQARLFQGRADLLSRYSSQINQAISDYHWSLRLGTDRDAEAWLSLSRCYNSIGERYYATKALQYGYRLAVKADNVLALGLCYLEQGSYLYARNKLKKAISRIEAAGKIFEHEGRLDLRAVCHYRLGLLLLFNNQSAQALSKAQLTEDDSLKAGYRNGLSEAEFLRGQIYVYLNDIERARHSLERAFDIAQEGPSFKLLGDILLYLADLYMKQRQPLKAVEAEEEAMRLYGLNGRVSSYATARSIRDIYQIHGEDRPSLELLNSAKESAAGLEACGDNSVAVVMWAALGIACLMKDSAESVALMIHALKRCKRLASDFEAATGKTSKDGLFGFKDPDLRLNAHVQEYATLFDLLSTLRREGGEDAQSDSRRYVKTKYFEFRSNHEMHDYASPESEVLAAIVSSIIFNRGWSQFKDLVPYDPSQGDTQFAAKAVRDFCDKKGFWQYEAFLRILPGA